MKIALLLTGNELMTGDTVDSNSSMIAHTLNPQGFDIDRKVTVGDDTALLVSSLESLAEDYSLVIVNGGLGPTDDDLTATALAELTGGELVEHAAALAHLQEWCAERSIALNAANLKQAMLPGDADIIANPIGSAVGISLRHGNCLILSTPGVPSELRLMLDEQIVPALQREFPQARSRQVRRLRLFGVGESSLQQRVSDQVPDWPASVTLGFRVCMPLIELKLEIESDEHIADQQWCEQRLTEVFPGCIIGENDQTMAEVLVEALRQQGASLTIAESCTGGLIASEITSVAGASEVFEAGFVTYSNEIKRDILSVDEALLDSEGAVSEAVVRAMAEGALARSSADYAIAVSGIAGPGGGSEEKPVGTVWVACGSASKMHAQCFRFPRSRKLFQQVVACLAMDILRRQLLGYDTSPNFFGAKK